MQTDCPGLETRNSMHNIVFHCAKNVKLLLIAKCSTLKQDSFFVNGFEQDRVSFEPKLKEDQSADPAGDRPLSNYLGLWLHETFD